MAQAPRDENYVPTALFEIDGAPGSVMPGQIDEITGRILVAAASGSGDVIGPAGATDNAIARFDGASGTLIQNSAVIIADTTGAITGTQSVTIGVAGSATGTLLMKGTTSGTVTVTTADAAGTWTLTLPENDGDSGQVLTTDGAGVTSWATVSGNVTKVGTPVNNQLGVWTGDGTIEGDADLTWDGGLVIVVDDTENKIGLTVTQNDVTNNPAAVHIITPVDASSSVNSYPLIVENTATGANGAFIQTYHNSATPASDDYVGGWDMFGEDSAGNKTNYASINAVITDPTNGSEDARLVLGVMQAGTFRYKVSLTDSALTPTTSDETALGGVALQWSDLYLASGAVINFANGNSVITHSSAVLTVSTGDLRVTTAGTNTASVVTVGGTQTLTAKTLTSPSLGGTALLAEGASIGLDPAGSADGAYSGITVTGVAGYAQTYGDLVYLSSVDSRWELADADAASTSDRMMAMVVVAGGSDGAACTLLLQGIIRADAKFPALTIGSAVYVGETAGAIQVAIPTGADNVIRRVGYAMTADEIYFSPSMDSQITVA